MATLIADNAYGTLGAGLATTDTALTFSLGHGARFPAVTAPDVLYCCILNANNILEEVIMTAHTLNADTATISRAAGATTAKAWNTGDRIEARVSSTVLTNLTSLGTSAGAVNVKGGAAGQVVYQVGTSSSGFTALGTASNVLLSGGTGAPTWLPQASLVVGLASTSTTAFAASTATTALISSTATVAINSPQSDAGVNGIGMMIFAYTTSSVASGGTINGANISTFSITSTGASPGTAYGAGTWRNVDPDVTGGPVGKRTGNFQRIS